MRMLHGSHTTRLGQDRDLARHSFKPTMVEGSRDRRLYGTGNYAHLDVPPPWVTGGAGRLSQRPTTACSALSELRFVSDDESPATDPKDTEAEPCLSHWSPNSQLHFASPEDITPFLTPIETEPASRISFLSFSTSDSSSLGSDEELDQLTPSDESARVFGKRPLPEVPGQAQSRPLPSRPMAAGPADPLSRTLAREFIEGCSKDSLVVSQPASGPGPDTRGHSVEEERQVCEPLPEDTPLVHNTPATPPSLSLGSVSSPPPPPSPPRPSLEAIVTFPKTPKPYYSYPRDLTSPTRIDLVTAAGLPIAGENGEHILFGALFRDRKVIVIFIRYFWCLFCDDYVRSISKSVTPEILKNKGVDLVVIANGAPDLIKMYKKMQKFPFKVYTDPSSQLHDALGLYKTSEVHAEAPRERGGGSGYLKSDGRWASLRIAVREAAAKVVHGYDPGNLEQLGGEFVFGPGLKSLFVHKMQNIRGHAPIVEVLEAAGVHVREKIKVRGSESSTAPSPTTPTSKVVDICGSGPRPFAISLPTTIATSITSTTTSISFDRGDGNSGLAWVAEPTTPVITDRAEWMAHRTDSLTRIKQKKEARRRGASFADS